jgi:hypothetical protein
MMHDGTAGVFWEMLGCMSGSIHLYRLHCERHSGWNCSQNVWNELKCHGLSALELTGPGVNGSVCDLPWRIRFPLTCLHDVPLTLTWRSHSGAAMNLGEECPRTGYCKLKLNRVLESNHFQVLSSLSHQIETAGEKETCRSVGAVRIAGSPQSQRKSDRCRRGRESWRNAGTVWFHPFYTRSLRAC